MAIRHSNERFTLGLQSVFDKVETAILVDKFNDGHGTHKEEKGSTGFTKVLLDNLAHGISI